MMPMLFVIFLDMFKLCSFQFRFESMKMDRWMDRCMHNRHGRPMYITDGRLEGPLVVALPQVSRMLCGDCM